MCLMGADRDDPLEPKKPSLSISFFLSERKVKGLRDSIGNGSLPEHCLPTVALESRVLRKVFSGRKPDIFGGRGAWLAAGCRTRHELGWASERSYPRVGDHEEASRKVVCPSHVVDDGYDADDIDIRPSVGNKEDFSPATVPL